MNKRVALIETYAEVIRKRFDQQPDMELLTKVVIGLGPSIYNSDSSRVSGSDPAELDTVRQNFLIGKLGLADGPELTEAIDRIMEDYGISERNKYRAVVYYLLVMYFKKQDIYG